MAISKLKPGDKVLATSTKTGKTQAESIAAVLVHHDKDLYDLKVRAAGHTTVIKTTRSHLFWNQATHHWTKASALKYGTHLHTPRSGSAIVLGGWTPKVTTGWMWDLTIPGKNDHDFYIRAAANTVLVHNVNEGRAGSCGGPNAPDDAGPNAEGANFAQRTSARSSGAARWQGGRLVTWLVTSVQAP